MSKGDSKTGNFKDGHWNVVHLKFLVDFMDAAGLTMTDLSAKMGIVRQTVYHWLVNDDMKLSLVHRLFDSCGYEIVFSYLKEDTPEHIPVTVDMTVLPPDNPKRLAFMDTALKRCGLDRVALAERLHIGKSTVYHWFRTDDCFISYIYKVAELTGLRLAIRIRPL